MIGSIAQMILQDDIPSGVVRKPRKPNSRLRKDRGKKHKWAVDPKARKKTVRVTPKGKWQLKAEAMKPGEHVKLSSASAAEQLCRRIKELGEKYECRGPSKFWFVTKL